MKMFLYDDIKYSSSRRYCVWGGSFVKKSNLEMSQFFSSKHFILLGNKIDGFEITSKIDFGKKFKF